VIYDLKCYKVGSVKEKCPYSERGLNCEAIVNTIEKKLNNEQTNISQLCKQFTININFAKTFQGLATRIVSKITSFTMIQYQNFFVFKRSLNKFVLNA
jgi:hypothetical protein